jgi:hypothetical protein
MSKRDLVPLRAIHNVSDKGADNGPVPEQFRHRLSFPLGGVRGLPTMLAVPAPQGILAWAAGSRMA